MLQRENHPKKRLPTTQRALAVHWWWWTHTVSLSRGITCRRLWTRTAPSFHIVSVSSSLSSYRSVAGASKREQQASLSKKLQLPARERLVSEEEEEEKRSPGVVVAVSDKDDY